MTNSPKSIYNRPGLPAIVYRIGDYNSFRERLISQISTQLVIKDTIAQRSSLAKLTTRSNEDPAIALLDAWAVVADVLTFYQERIANEGYLRTATERFSVLQLARSIGYELSPGVAASTYLAFTVDDAVESVTQAIVPQGTPVMSIPTTDDEVPQTFETSAEILTHLDWNSIQPRLSKPQEIGENLVENDRLKNRRDAKSAEEEDKEKNNQIYLQGTSTQLQPGDWVLLVANQEQNIQTYLLKLTAVELSADNNYTLISWEKQLPQAIKSRLRNPQIFAFRNSASLFGKNAPLWKDMPDEIKKAGGGTVVGGVFCSEDNGSNWTPQNKNLANTDILCLATDKSSNSSSKYLFAGTPDRGIFRLPDDGENWEAVNAGLTNLNIQALYIQPEKGYVFAGTPGGGVFRSKDNGDNWVPIHTGSVRVQSQGDNNWQSINTAIPNTVVRSLVTCAGDDKQYIFAGTDDNIYRSENQGKDWYTTNNSNSATNECNPNLQGLPGKAVLSLMVTEITGIISDIDNSDKKKITVSKLTGELKEGDVIAVGDEKIKIVKVPSNENESEIILTLDKEVDTNLNTPIACTTNKFNIFAGTDDGIYRSSDYGNRWQPITEYNNNIKRVFSLTHYQRDGLFYLFAGTDNGIYSSLNRENWTNINNDLLENVPVYALDNHGEHLFAGTNQGIFVSTDNGGSWKKVKNEDLIKKKINITSDNGGSSDKVEDEDLNKKKINITSLAVKNINDDNHKIFAGALFSGFVEDKENEENEEDKENQWPHFKFPDEVKLEKIDLNTIYPKILENSWMVLLNENRFQAIKVDKVSTDSVSEFSLTSEVTKITFNNSADLSDFGRRKTQVLIQSESLALAPEVLTVTMQQENIFLDPINKDKIYLSKFISDLHSDKTLIVSGKHIRALAEDVGGFFVWNADESKWQRQNQGLTNTNIQALAIDKSKNKYYIGTNQGVFHSFGNNQANNHIWEPLQTKGLEETDIQSLWIHPKNKSIFVGTPSGIFNYSDSGWKSKNQGLVHKNVQTLVSYFNQEEDTISIFAGTFDGGVFVSRNNGDSWNSTGLTNVDIQTLVVNANGHLFAGTFQKGIFYSENQGNSWRQLTNIERGTGTISSDNITVTGVGLNSEQLQVGDIINAGGQTRTIVSINNETQIFTVDTAFRPDLPERTAFTINTGLTNLNITSLLILPQEEEMILFAGTGGSGVFRSQDSGKRWQQVNTNLKDLEIRTLAANSSNDSNNKIFVGTARKGIFHSVDNGDSWQAINDNLTNTDVKAIAISADNNIIAAGNGILVSQDGFYTVPLNKSDLLWVISPPVKDKYLKWLVRDINGFVGNIETITDKELLLQPATEEDGIVSEVCTIKKPPTEQQNPVIVLKKPLKYAYDPETVTIYANVVMATHGETVVEVMGNGDGTIPNQSFILKQPPLTYVPAATASGAKSTLEVRVNDVLWEEVDSLYEQDTHLQGYIIRLTDDATSIITFGDGENGTRLPTGEENVTATYRSGIGLEGQVAAESLTQLKDKPLGILEVINPLSASGAAPPESRDEAREKAPSQVRTLDRIVSLQDFEDFSRAFAGIGRASAVPLWNGQSQLVHITVAAADGSQVDTDSNLYQQLVAAIDNNRDPIQFVEVDSYELQLFNVEAKLQFNPRYQEELLIEQVSASLKAKFTFSNRKFGQDVTAAEVIATIQQIEGVVAVDLDALYKLGSSKNLQQSLRADLARWDEENDIAKPAQLLLINPQDIKLTTI
ncbi:MAG: putative baseplate assembly protein [Rivularia sp. (in: Bacteria)]|nr:putative baseplate assembly protein [Rivularia sp. MS3]